MDRPQAYTLYTCHALSAWNARSYEFAAVLLTAAAYPGGLRAASLLQLSRNLSAILLGPSIGRWIDAAPNRLRPLLATIAANRASIVLGCLLWLLVVAEVGPDGGERERASLEGAAKAWVFGAVVVLGLVENVSRKANVISMERDWVPLLAPDTLTERFSLTQVNAMMTRIDAACKMLSPIVISWVFSVIPSVKSGVGLLIATNLVSFFLEWITAKSVYRANPILREIKAFPDVEIRDRRPGGFARMFERYLSWLAAYGSSMQLYFSYDVWRASFALCLTHASILSFTGVTIVFFLNSGYSLQLITIGEAMSAFFELSATFVTPVAVHRLASRAASKDIDGYESLPESDPDDVPRSPSSTAPARTPSQINNAVTKVGLHGALSTALILTPTVPALLYLTYHLNYPLPRSPTTSPSLIAFPLLTSLLFFCLAASRMTRGVLDLAVQQLSQARVPPRERAEFAGVEQVFVSVFGLAHNVGTAVWSGPAQFGWLALYSLVAIVGSAVLYVAGYRRMRM
jgi:iron-regulated transporter 1